MWQPQRDACHRSGRHGDRRAVHHDTGVGARAAHVHRQEITVPDEPPGHRRSEDTTNRTRKRQRRGAVARQVGPHRPSVRRHDLDPGQPALVRSRCDATEIVTDLGPQVGLRRRRAHPFVLPEGRQHLATGSHRHLGVSVTDGSRHPSLVRRITKAEQKAHGDRCRAVLPDRTQHPFDLFVLQPDDWPIGAHPLQGTDDRIAVDERRRMVQGQIVEPRAILPAEPKDILETPSGHEQQRPATPFEEGVRRDRGAMDQCRAGDGGGRGSVDGIPQSLRRVSGSR